MPRENLVASGLPGGALDHRASRRIVRQPDGHRTELLKRADHVKNISVNLATEMRVARTGHKGAGGVLRTTVEGWAKDADSQKKRITASST